MAGAEVFAELGPNDGYCLYKPRLPEKRPLEGHPWRLPCLSAAHWPL